MVGRVFMADCWDPRKNQENQRNHHISFEDAREVFKDPNLFEVIDDRDYDEERWRAIGRVGEMILVVIYSERACGEWLISARKAEPYEEEGYFTRET